MIRAPALHQAGDGPVADALLWPEQPRLGEQRLARPCDRPGRVAPTGVPRRREFRLDRLPPFSGHDLPRRRTPDSHSTEQQRQGPPQRRALWGSRDCPAHVPAGAGRARAPAEDLSGDPRGRRGAARALRRDALNGSDVEVVFDAPTRNGRPGATRPRSTSTSTTSARTSGGAGRLLDSPRRRRARSPAAARLPVLQALLPRHRVDPAARGRAPPAVGGARLLPPLRRAARPTCWPARWPPGSGRLTSPCRRPRTAPSPTCGRPSAASSSRRSTSSSRAVDRARRAPPGRRVRPELGPASSSSRRRRRRRREPRRTSRGDGAGRHDGKASRGAAPSGPTHRSRTSAALRVVEARVRSRSRAARDGPRSDDPFRGLYISRRACRPAARRASRGPARRRRALARVEAAADEAGRQGSRRLRRLERAFGLEPLDVELLLVALAPDLDARFERLYGYLHDDVTRRRASIGLALELAAPRLAPAAARQRLTAAPLVVGRARRRGGRRPAVPDPGAAVPDRSPPTCSATITPIPPSGASSPSRIPPNRDPDGPRPGVARAPGSSTCASRAAPPAARSPPQRSHAPVKPWLRSTSRRSRRATTRRARPRGAARGAAPRRGLVAGPVDRLAELDRSALRALAVLAGHRADRGRRVGPGVGADRPTDR